MSDIPEAIGTATQGGLYARAVERESGHERGDAEIDASGHFAEGACLNCGTELIGSHCHACGQKAHLHRTLSAVGHDLVHGVLHLDGKLWRTLPMLALHPGKLTRRYIDGQRRDFVSPMAMFLFSVFLMFAVFQASGLSAPADIPDITTGAQEKAVEAKRQFEQEYNALAEDRTAERAEVRRKIAEVDAAMAAMEVGEDFSFENADGDRTYQTFNLTGIDWIDNGIVQKWRKNPGLMLYKLQTNAYKFSWLLIPLSIPFVWLLFSWKRRFKAYDHAIFVTYSLAFMSLLFIVGSLFSLTPLLAWLSGLLVLLAPPVHLYRHLRGTYELGRLSTVWRLAVLLVTIIVVTVLFLQILLLLGAF